MPAGNQTEIAGLFFKGGLGLRDILIGSLLTMDWVMRNQLHPTDPIFTKICAELDLILGPLDGGQIELPDDIRYGIPRWLADDPESGLSTFLSRLTERGEYGKTIVDMLPARFDEKLLLLLESFSSVENSVTAQKFQKLYLGQSGIDSTGRAEETALAAAGTIVPSLARIRATARRATVSSDPVLEEIGSRLLRMDFVVVHKSRENAGVVLGAFLDFRGDDDHVTVSTPLSKRDLGKLGTPDWEPASDAFVEGLKNGRDAAIRLLTAVGVESEKIERLRKVRTSIRGLLPPAIIDDGSAGLPLALSLVSEASDLALPLVVPSGVFGPTGRLEAMSEGHIRAKARGVQEDGFRNELVVYARDCPPIEGVRRIPEDTLESACGTLWGDAWSNWAQRTKSRTLDSLGLVEGWNSEWEGALTLDDVRLVAPMIQADKIVDSLQSTQSPMLIMLGGHAQSGKTWIAQDVREKLLAHGDWQICVLRPVSRQEPPDFEELAKALRMLMPPEPFRKRLLILDDLEWIEEERLEQALVSTRDECNTSILAAIRSDSDTEWKVESALNPPAVLTREAQEAFAQGLVHRYLFLKRAEASIGTAVNLAGGNLWLLVRFLHMAATLEGQANSNGLLAEYNERYIRNLERAEKEEMMSLASLSFAGIGAPDWFLDATSEFLISRGARRSMGNRWWLLSRYACRSIIVIAELKGTGERVNLAENKAYLRNFILERICRYLRRAIKGHHDDVVDALFKLRRNKESDLLSLSVQVLGTDLVDWAVEQSDPLRVTRALEILREEMDDEQSEPLVRHHLSLLTGQMAALAPAHLALALKVVRLNCATVTRLKNQKEIWENLVGALKRDLPIVLGGRSMPQARARLLREVRRVLQLSSREDILGANHVILANLELFLRPAGPIAAEDYSLALELRRIARQVDGWRNEYFSQEKFPSLHRLANFAPDDGCGLLAYVSWIVLRVEMDMGEVTYEKLLQRERNAILGRLRHSSAAEAARTIQVLYDNNPAFGAAFFKHLDIEEILRGLIAKANAGEAAVLLGELARCYGRSARAILYSATSDAVNRTLALTLANQIRSRGDAKGAGKLLQIARNIDVSFGMIEGGFAKVLGDQIGQQFFERQFIDEPRTAVIYHLLRGMIAVGVQFSDHIEEQTVQLILRNIVSNRKEWAPRLALMLIEDGDLAIRFIPRFVQELDNNPRFAEGLQRGMQNARSLEAMAAFHDLGPALRPSLAGDFVAFLDRELGNSKDPRLFRSLYRGDQPDVMTRAARAMSKTLRRGGIQHPGRLLLDSLQVKWVDTLSRARSCGEMAESIRNLRDLEWETAFIVVDDLPIGVLKKRLDWAFFEQPIAAIELLDAIEEACPGKGRDIVRQFVLRTNFWKHVMEEIAFEQDARTQGSAFRRLAELGAYPTHEQQEKIFNSWIDRIGKVGYLGGLANLLQAFAAWNWEWAVQASGRINVRLLGLRLKGKAKADLECVEQLLGALHALNHHQACNVILEELRGMNSLPSLLGLNQSIRLLFILHEFDRDFGKVFLHQTEELLWREFTSPCMLNDVEMVVTLGWFAQAARLYGVAFGNNHQSLAPPAWWREAAMPGAVALWGTAWLPETQWTDEVFSRAVEEQIRELQADALSKREGWALAALLCVSATSSRQDPNLQSIITRQVWDGAIKSHPYSLEVLVRACINDSELFELLKADVQLIRERIDQPFLRLHPAVHRIRGVLSPFERSTG